MHSCLANTSLEQFLEVLSVWSLEVKFWIFEVLKWMFEVWKWVFDFLKFWNVYVLNFWILLINDLK